MRVPHIVNAICNQTYLQPDLVTFHLTWRIEKIVIMSSLSLNKLKKKIPSNLTQKPKKKLDRFDGLTEEDLQSCKLPDILRENLDMVFVGINPSLTAAYRGRYYAGPGNHFYKLLYESQLTPHLLHHDEDSTLLEYGIGLTNIVERPSRSSSDLKKSEIKEGAKKVEAKLILFRPKVAIFNGKGIYEVFSNKTGKSDFSFGLQPVRLGDTAIWVVPSSSARCAHFPRMVDKLHFYSALKKYLLHVNGKLPDIDEREFSFEGKCKIFDPTTSKMWRRKEVSAFMHGGRVANKETLLNASGTSLSDINSPKKMKMAKNGRKSPRCINSSMEIVAKEKLAGSEEEENCVDSNIEVRLCSRNENDDKDVNNSLSSPKVIKVSERKDVVNFVDLIKQRLSQNDKGNEDNSALEPGAELSEQFHSIVHDKPVRKLKYSALNRNRLHSFVEDKGSFVNTSETHT